MMVSEFLVAVIWGILITLFLEILGILLWFYTITDAPPSRKIRPSRAKTPEAVNATSYDPPSTSAGGVPGSSSRSNSPSPLMSLEQQPPESLQVLTDQRNAESCDWLNCLIDFVFHQVRDSPELKKLMMKQINKEFMEILLTKTQGKMLERLSVREYDMGVCLPVISNVTVVKAKKDDEQNPTIVEVDMDVDYKGGFQLSIDADLVFNKAAFVSVQVKLVRGRGRLMFSTDPFSHWSFTFLSDPELDLVVTSRFEGRELRQLSNFLKAQILRWVKKFYTFPNYKVRFKPFFQRIKYQDQLTDVHVHDSQIAQGKLLVKIVECSRLIIPDSAVELYCTASVGDTPTDPQIGIWQTAWPSKEVTVYRSSPLEEIGMKYESVLLHDDNNKKSKFIIIVTKVDSNSPSANAGIKRGDILHKAENVNISSVHQADKLIKNTQILKLLIMIRRPTFDLLKNGTVESEKKTKKKSSRHKRSKSPVIPKSKGATPFPEVNVPTLTTPEEEEEHDDEEQHTAPFQLSLPTDKDDYSDEDRRSLEESTVVQQQQQQQYTFHDSSINSGGVSTNTTGFAVSHLRERTRSSPMPMMETDQHRPLVSSLDPYDASHKRSSGNDETSETVHMKPLNDSTVENTLDSYTTKSVSVSKNPNWNEEFKYFITSKKNYLNVCVWCKLQGEHKNFMIGNVTISLTDVALECSASGVHKQRYVLLPAKDMKTSKMALKAMTAELPPNAKMGGMNTVPKYVGDIYLGFLHEPTEESPMDNPMTAASGGITDSSDSFLDIDIETSFRNHPFTAEQGTEPDKHEFQVCRETKVVCCVCQKKIKKKPMKCSRCGIYAHENKSCVGYCKKVVPCKTVEDDPKETPKDTPHIERDQSWVELNRDGEQIYHVSKPMIRDEDTLPLVSEDSPSMDDKAYVESEELDRTPPPLDNSDSEEEIEKHKHDPEDDYTDGTGFVNIIPPDVLEKKIVEAQKNLETLESNRRSLESETLVSKDYHEYKLSKIDAQIETTQIKLKEYKEQIRHS